MENNKKTSTAIKKSISLLQKIDKMIEEDRYCIDVIQQILAVI
jgi:DNA-binding FrmR family transcriptional regulator